MHLGLTNLNTQFKVFSDPTYEDKENILLFNNKWNYLLKSRQSTDVEGMKSDFRQATSYLKNNDVRTKLGKKALCAETLNEISTAIANLEGALQNDLSFYFDGDVSEQQSTIDKIVQKNSGETLTDTWNWKNENKSTYVKVTENEVIELTNTAGNPLYILHYEGIRAVWKGKYSASTIYNIGNLVSRENILYVCKENNVSGDWNINKWVPIIRGVESYAPVSVSYDSDISQEQLSELIDLSVNTLYVHSEYAGARADVTIYVVPAGVAGMYNSELMEYSISTPTASVSKPLWAKPVYETQDYALCELYYNDDSSFHPFYPETVFNKEAFTYCAKDVNKYRIEIPTGTYQPNTTYHIQANIYKFMRIIPCPQANNSSLADYKGFYFVDHNSTTTLDFQVSTTKTLSNVLYFDVIYSERGGIEE